ncbi:capsular biosynthesis protein [Burkholderia thailandensis]|uniref:Capsule polysaccharide biosynthesis family protein n=1 Tax=Burkholderia thailandensis TaxID=57975 RepID=A0AAW9CZQ4_BURTH|nr:capsular polysaccharide biosynthesis protein [Burkholderia thailandensis]MCS3390805.1 capsular biosynthesis protein [Burkholderia thailandensis]MCS6423760.1 capsular biosynthesis protein [Burkholderia thailandensis]MCS6450976.1 capsular biosynthesis protein [Burkholderia thailandensis]MCS6463317.1 capsular biosynthesis protein [Burkholderia thailandensis]MCS6481129.1 capsular biosynthesis protein [Burkholderia thailandensis]
MIVVVVDSMERYYFAARLVKAVRQEFDFLFATSEPVAHLMALGAGLRSVYLRRGASVSGAHDAPAAIRSDASIEVLNGQMASGLARADAAAVFAVMSGVFRRYCVSQCLMWNGQQLVCRAVAQACAAHGVPTKFVEISNLPDKLFVDRLGVNALSSISRNPAVIDGLPMPTEDEHRRWLARYEQYKSRPLPQSRTSSARKAVSAVNYALKLATQGVARKRLNTVRATNGASAPAQAKALTVKELSALRYVFLPLQVSGDTQIKLHSDVDNLKAIQLAFEHAANVSADLIVKLHPAECDAAVIDEVVRMQQVYHFDLVTSPTTDLIKHAHSVVTINSTVGLEALLYGKPVMSLGRCFYKEFDRVRLLKYIHAFLIDGIDYFGKEDIAPRAARNVFSMKH